jgi:16S rRNA (uracil1498-N3)-methyltransferase
VLRGRPGDSVEVVSGDRLFAAELRESREILVLEELESTVEGPEVVLYQAVPKGRHMDLVVEKATELGVSRVVPLVTERGVVRLGGGGSKVERWRRVAEAAARQSLRLRVPEVSEPVGFDEAVRSVGEDGVLLHNGAGLPALESVLGDSAPALFVGPEGGWSDEELRVGEEEELSLGQLGPYRLRSETAGISAVARAVGALERTARGS